MEPSKLLCPFELKALNVVVSFLSCIQQLVLQGLGEGIS